MHSFTLSRTLLGWTLLTALAGGQGFVAVEDFFITSVTSPDNEGFVHYVGKIRSKDGAPLPVDWEVRSLSGAALLSLNILDSVEEVGEPLISDDATTVFGANRTSLLAWSAGRVRDKEVLALHGLSQRNYYINLRDVSNDGEVVVGTRRDSTQIGIPEDPARQESFFWTESDGRTVLPPLLGYHTTNVQAVSGDGTTFLGNALPSCCNEKEQIPQVVLWERESDPVAIDAFDGVTELRGIDLSADGSVVVGTMSTVPLSLPLPVFMWSDEEGVRRLPNSEGFWLDPDFPRANQTNILSGDGSTIVGAGRKGERTEAMIWTEKRGAAFLSDVIQFDLGLDIGFDGYALRRAHINASGTHVYGDMVRFDGDGQTPMDFVLDLRPSLAADGNFDGVVDILDFALLKAGFGVEGAWRDGGDFTSDGIVDLSDFSLLKSSFGKRAPQSVPEPNSLHLALSFASVAWVLSLRASRCGPAKSACPSRSVRRLGAPASE